MRTPGIHVLVQRLQLLPRLAPFRGLLLLLNDANSEFQWWVVETGKKVFTEEGMLTTAYSIREIESAAARAVEEFATNQDVEMLVAELESLERRLRALPADLEQRAERNKE